MISEDQYAGIRLPKINQRPAYDRDENEFDALIIGQIKNITISTTLVHDLFHISITNIYNGVSSHRVNQKVLSELIELMPFLKQVPLIATDRYTSSKTEALDILTSDFDCQNNFESLRNRDADTPTRLPCLEEVKTYISESNKCASFTTLEQIKTTVPTDHGMISINTISDLKKTMVVLPTNTSGSFEKDAFSTPLNSATHPEFQIKQIDTNESSLLASITGLRIPIDLNPGESFWVDFFQPDLNLHWGSQTIYADVLYKVESDIFFVKLNNKISCFIQLGLANDKPILVSIQKFVRNYWDHFLIAFESINKDSASPFINKIFDNENTKSSKLVGNNLLRWASERKKEQSLNMTIDQHLFEIISMWSRDKKDIQRLLFIFKANMHKESKERYFPAIKSEDHFQYNHTAVSSPFLTEDEIESGLGSYLGVENWDD